jgi:hypothetical protein
MNSHPTMLSSRSLPTPDRRSKRATVSEEPGKKPRKPNSEIRKQQNRIASRNYREKRKRKLQYLQQLVNDDSDGHQNPEPSPEQHEVYPRSLSADYEVAGPSSSSPYITSTTRAFDASSAVATQTILAATAASMDTHHHTAEQTYSYPPNWNTPIYSPPPPPNIPWNMPPTWMSSLAYPSHSTTTTRPPMYRYTTHPTQPLYQQTHTPSPSYLPSRDFSSNADIYGYSGANYASSQSQADGNLNQYVFTHDSLVFERSVYI